MALLYQLPLLIAFLILIQIQFLAVSITDPLDLAALKAMYESLNNPTQLTGWNFVDGDPCGSSQVWKGVTCSNQSVTSIYINGSGLSGQLSPQISNLLSLQELDLSYNNIGGEIPHGLPPNATYINLAVNSFGYSLAYPLPSVKALIYLNASHNGLSGPIGDVFSDMPNLDKLDLSFNHFTGDLPSSFTSLRNLHELCLQNNDLTGSIGFLANLPLRSLYLENNHFSGYVPRQFKFIPNLRIDANQFEPGFETPSSFVNRSAESPQTSRDAKSRTIPESKLRPLKTHNSHKRLLATTGIMCSVLLVVLFVSIVLVLLCRPRITKLKKSVMPRESFFDLPVTAPKVSTVDKDQIISLSPPIPLIIATPTRVERLSRRKSCSRKSTNLEHVEIFSPFDLLKATNNYSNDSVIGNGLNGFVYISPFPDGQMFAVKKFKLVANEVANDEFLKFVNNTVRLKHPNINNLVGYSIDQEEHVIVYEYAKNGSLNEVLHSSESCKSLSWKIRLRIALGVGYALEYMHCICSPRLSHGNLKATNVLLDHELMPRLTDCGFYVLRHLIKPDTKAPELDIESNGYAAPELNSPGADMTKCDVYSFGILLLELLTGRKPFDRSRSKEEQLLVRWAYSRLHDIESLESMVDPEIKGSIPSKALSQYADIILSCIQWEAGFRSIISAVTGNLLDVVQKLSRPHQRSSRKQRRSSVDDFASDVNATSEISFKSTLAYFDSPSAPAYD